MYSDNNPDYEINKTFYEESLETDSLEAADKNSKQQSQGMVTEIVNNNTATAPDTTPDNNDKKDEDKKKGLFGFFN